MKTVGLLTCYLDNFGACLQAYALQNAIEALGYKCEIVRYTPHKSMLGIGSSDTLYSTIISNLRALINGYFFLAPYWI